MKTLVQRGQTFRSVAPAGGIVNTTETTVQAAPGAGKALHLTELDIINGNATGTELVFRDGVGGPVIYRTYAIQAAGHQNVKFWEPVPLSVNAALTVQAGTTAAQVYINARGVIL